MNESILITSNFGFCGSKNGFQEWKKELLKMVQPGNWGKEN